MVLMLHARHQVAVVLGRPAGRAGSASTSSSCSAASSSPPAAPGGRPTGQDRPPRLLRPPLPSAVPDDPRGRRGVAVHAWCSCRRRRSRARPRSAPRRSPSTSQLAGIAQGGNGPLGVVRAPVVPGDRGAVLPGLADRGHRLGRARFPSALALPRRRRGRRGAPPCTGGRLAPGEGLAVGDATIAERTDAPATAPRVYWYHSSFTRVDGLLIGCAWPSRREPPRSDRLSPRCSRRSASPAGTVDSCAGYAGAPIGVLGLLGAVVAESIVYAATGSCSPSS